MGLAPIIRKGDESEVAGWARVINLERFHDYTEEFRRCITALVEPIKCLTVLLTKLGSDPNNHCGIMSSGIGEKLTEVIMVGCLDLILYDHHPFTT